MQQMEADGLEIDEATALEGKRNGTKIRGTPQNGGLPLDCRRNQPEEGTLTKSCPHNVACLVVFSVISLETTCVSIFVGVPLLVAQAMRHWIFLFVFQGFQGT